MRRKLNGLTILISAIRIAVSFTVMPLLLLKNVASTFVGRNLVKLIPIAGWIVSAAVAAGVTEAIGWTIAVDFANNARREWDRKRNAEEAAQAYAAAEKYKQAARHTETDEDAEDFSEE